MGSIPVLQSPCHPLQSRGVTGMKKGPGLTPRALLSVLSSLLRGREEADALPLVREDRLGACGPAAALALVLAREDHVLGERVPGPGEGDRIDVPVADDP